MTFDKLVNALFHPDTIVLKYFECNMSQGRPNSAVEFLYESVGQSMNTFTFVQSIFEAQREQSNTYYLNDDEPTFMVEFKLNNTNSTTILFGSATQQRTICSDSFRHWYSVFFGPMIRTYKRNIKQRPLTISEKLALHCMEMQDVGTWSTLLPERGAYVYETSAKEYVYMRFDIFALCDQNMIALSTENSDVTIEIANKIDENMGILIEKLTKMRAKSTSPFDPIPCNS